jgi:hypothetical protein
LGRTFKTVGTTSETKQRFTTEHFEVDATKKKSEKQHRFLVFLRRRCPIRERAEASFFSWDATRRVSTFAHERPLLLRPTVVRVSVAPKFSIFVGKKDFSKI